MKKRLLSIILAIVLASGTIPAMTVPVQADTIGYEPTSNKCGNNATWELSGDGVLSITGSGDIYDNIAWSNNNNIKEVNIEEGITYLPSDAFAYCENLSKVTLPKSLQSIPSNCFEHCSSLTSIQIPEDVTSIGDYAFRNCVVLDSISIPNTVKDIGLSAFEGCTDLTKVELPNSIAEINREMFADCTNLTYIALPNSITRIEDGAFENCKNLQISNMPKLLYHIGFGAFRQCEKIETLDFSNTALQYISINAFNGCEGLKAVILPNTVKYIGFSAFSQCANLNSVTFNGSPRQFRAINIENDNEALKHNENFKYKYTPATGLTLSDSSLVVQDHLRYNTWIKATIEPSNATDTYIECESSDPDVANIVDIRPDKDSPDDEANNKFSLCINTNNVGQATISVTIDDGDGHKFTATCNVNVVSPKDYAEIHFINPDKETDTTITTQKNTVLKATDIPEVTRDGYKLIGWSSSGKIIDLTQPITEGPLYLYPVWQKNTVDVTLSTDCPESDDNDNVYQTQTVDRNSIFSQPAAPIRKGYSFVKWYVWYTDKDEKSAQYDYDFSKSIGDNIKAIQALSDSNFFNSDRLNLTAEMSQNSITVTYHLNGVGGKDILTTKTTKYNGFIDKEIYPAVPGYAFLGWYTDKDCTTKEIDWANVDKNVDLYAGWLKFADYSNSTSTQTTINNIDNVTIATPQSDNGTTSVTDGKDKGTASITTNPSSGYETDKIRVISEDGKEIPVKKTGENTYTFDTQKGNAAVVVTYKPKEMPFSDVSANAYYYEPVQWALQKGITSGTSATSFSPSKPCKRSEMVTFLWRMAGSPKVSGNIQFNDIPNDAYYKDALLWAIQNGITSGKTSNTFAPNDPCNRGQMATFLWRMSGKPESSRSTFEDVKGTDYYSTAISWLKSSGITAGKSKTLFDPTGDCTRGQMVTFLYRYSGNK